MEGKQGISEPGADQERVKDILDLEQRKYVRQLKERNNNRNDNTKENGKFAQLNNKKKSLQEHEFPAKSQKTDIVCAICNKTFIKKSNLKMHTAAAHERSKPVPYTLEFKCIDCQKEFSQKWLLIRHIAHVHEGKKPFQCDHCQKKFSQKPSLEKHVKSVHEGKKEFQCKECEKKFTQSSNLKAHIAAVHEKKKPHTCEICDAKFPNRQSLSNHIAHKHSDEKPYKCSICDKKSFSLQKGLNRHTYIKMYSEKNSSNQKGKKRESENALLIRESGITILKECNMTLLVLEVSRGIQNRKSFWLKINIFKGDYLVLRIVVVRRCQNSKSAKILLSKYFFYIKNHWSLSFFH